MKQESLISCQRRRRREVQAEMIKTMTMVDAENGDFWKPFSARRV
jgi:hypothetical protein